MGIDANTRTLDGDALQRSLDEGLEFLAEGRSAEALERFECAHSLDPGHARARSYYGVALGLVERRFEKSVELCRSAVKQEFFNPELYLNLAKVHLGFGFKAEAVRYLRRGQMIDPGNQAILTELRALGCRQRQVLAFLPRRHVLNRLLGRARNRVQLRLPA